jgi:hypothetical protein
MSKNPADLEKRMLAAAVFELRVILGLYIGRADGSPASAAADFAYALYNYALAALEGRSFSAAEALSSLERLEPVLGRNYLDHLRKVVLDEA